MATSAGDAKARVKVDMTKALNSLATIEKGEHMSEAEIARLEAQLARIEVEQVSLLLELKASKGDVHSLHAQAKKDREDMVKDYQGSLELIFAYGYGCCAFKNNICRDWPEIPDGMPDSACPLPLEFFVNPRCPSILAAVEAKDTYVDQGRAVEDLEGVLSLRNMAFFHMLASAILGNSASGAIWPLIHIYFICNL